MQAPPYSQHYRLLRSQGLSQVSAAIEVCRANRGHIEWIMYWLTTKAREPGIFRERWIRYVQAENKERAWFPGFVDEGCYFYSSLLHRPAYTVFIPWAEIAHIFIQDGLNHLALCLYSLPEQYGCKFIQAQDDMPGFEPFVQEVSRRFFGAQDYLRSSFRTGGHAVRKVQVWPKDENAELAASPKGGPATSPDNSEASEGPPSVS